jgi:hypothetical protein
MGNSSSAPQPSVKKGRASGLKKLIRETLSSDEDEGLGHSAEATDTDPSRPWWPDFKNYMDTLEAKPPAGMSTIEWWGVSI